MQATEQIRTTGASGRRHLPQSHASAPSAIARWHSSHVRTSASPATRADDA